MRKVKIISLIIFIFFIIYTGSVLAADEYLIYKSNFFVNNNVFPVLDLKEKDFTHPLTLSEDGIGIQDIEHRLIFKSDKANYYFGYIREYEQQVEVDNETIIFATESSQNKAHSQVEYNLDVNTCSQRLEGIIFGKEVWNNKKIGLHFNLNGKLLNGKELVQRNYQGVIKQKNDNYYMSGLKDGIYSNLSQHREEEGVDFYSQGYSLGYEVGWQITSNYYLQLEGENVYSKIEWEDVYTLVGKLDTDNLDINEDGYKSYESSFSGSHSYNDYVTQLTPEYDLALHTDRSEFGVFYRTKAYPYFNFKILTKPIGLKLGLYKSFLTFDLLYKKFKIGLLTKDLNINSSSGIGGQVSLQVSF